MTTLSHTPARTFADLLRQLGGVPPDRIRLDPPPGRATVQDVIDLYARERRLYELLDDTLVEKAAGIRKSILAGVIVSALRAFVIPRNLGIVTGGAGTMRLSAGLVRIPDVAFVSWGRCPGGRVPLEPVPDLSPDLAVEVLSESNTRAELDRKLREYFASGVRLAWVIDPGPRTASVYDAAGAATAVLDAAGVLDGGAVLPGFALPLADLFAELDRRA